MTTSLTSPGNDSAAITPLRNWRLSQATPPLQTLKTMIMLWSIERYAN